MSESNDFEIVSEDAQEIVLDESNEVSFPGYPYTFEALNEKVLVALDQYKSGYECKTCKGKGKVFKKCECQSTDRPLFKYSTEQLEDLKSGLGEVLAANRAPIRCSTCEGDPEYKEEVV